MHRKRFWLFLLSPFLLTFLAGTVSAQQPTANFTADVQNGCAGSPLVVNFEDLSSGNPTSWFWDFGDTTRVSISTLQNPSYIYNREGCFTVTLIVTNASGSDTLVQNCFVELDALPVPDITLDVSEGCAPLTVNFSDASTSTTNITNWFWNFTSGDIPQDQNPTVTFTEAPRTIGLTFTVTDANGCQATGRFSDLINVYEAPILDFTVDVNSACDTPLTVNITNTTITNGATLSYIWQTPGGNPVSSNLENPPPILYNQLNSFDVTLISIGSCSDTLSRSGFIGVGGVTASFSTSATEVCLGEAINFTNTSIGGVNSLEWIFGDGNTSTASNPVHTYDAVGTYSIELRANNPDGCGDTLVMTNLITVNPVPIADFGVDGQAGCLLPATFNFIDSSTNAVAWLWDFGDGSPTSNQQNPAHTYNNFNNFTVSLTVTNAEGCTATDTGSAPISIVQPQAAFGANTTQGCTPLVVNITDNSVSSDSIISWSWEVNVNNGMGGPVATSTDQNPSFTFNNTGNYDVSLIIETVSGCRDTVELQSYIQSGTPPMADFIVSRDTLCVNDTLTFTSLAFPGDSTWNYSWDFMYDAGAGFNELSNLDDPPFAYPDTGLFAVALIVENSGCRDTMIKEDFVFASPPRADFTIDNPLVCQLPATVTVTDNSIGPITDYEWFFNGVPFGGNSSDPGGFPVGTIGTHVIKLKVTYSLTGCVDSMELTFNAGNPIVDFETPDLRGCKPYTINLINNSQNIVSYQWTFSENRSSSAIVPPMAFMDTGFKQVELIGVDIYGCADTLTRVDYIEVLGPYADFSADNLTGCPPLAVQFTDLTTPYRNSTLTSWMWDFGDPSSGASNTSSLQNPSHDYNATGSYEVTLTVTDSDGCSDTQSIPDFILVTFPQPDFLVDDSMSCAGNILNFSDITLSPNASITDYLWRFGDGGTSTDANPSYAYADTGFYSVTLIVTDQNGCTDSITKTNFIYIEPFFAYFTGDPLSGICPPLNTSFFNLSQGSIASVEWNFGDAGFTSSLLSDTVGHTYITPGSYSISLEVTHEDGCVDQLLRQNYVSIGGPVGTFEILPSTSVCLGDTIQINVFSTRATSITADFRDGNLDSQVAIGDTLIQDTTTFFHVYDNPGCYIPFILLLDARGCPFDIDSTATICVIAPPNANITLSDTVGCPPVDLGLFDTSIPGDTSLASWLWTFGDGDSSNQQSPIHTYTLPNTYNISLTVIDSIGCSDSAFTTFEVFPGAVADFIASDTISCSPIPITFTDLSTGPAVISHEWYFGDGLGIGSTDPNPTYTYLTDSLYTVTLIIADEIGCSDTITKPNYINLRHPQAELEASSLLGCNPVTITFRSTGSFSDTTITQYQWCISDSLTNNMTCLSSLNVDSLNFNFSESGIYFVQLVITDALGCQDTSETLRLEISQRVVPPPITLRSVSVVSDTSVNLSWDAYALTDFISYVIYRTDPNGTIVLVDTIYDQLITTYVDVGSTLNAAENVYCYQVLVQNTCGEFSDLVLTQEHCTIELQASPGIDEIILDWTPYVGFTVAEYQIFRVISYDLGTAVNVGSVAGNILTFIDTAVFCRDSITYRVMAVDASTNGEISYSDISRGAPLHEVPTDPVDIALATVVNDTFVSISWEPYNGYRPDRFLLERSTDGITWDTLAQVPLSTLSYSDTAVIVDEFSYYYRVFAVDSCGDITPLGNHGQTILLKATLSGNGKQPILNWNHYTEWPLGILNYEIEVFNESSQSWDLVAIVPGTTNSFIDDITSLNQSSYCYRVRAIEAGGLASQSLSNEDCIIFSPLIFTPNAFSPNGDGHNDFFRVFVPNLNNAEIMIFDRWGELIFRSLNLDDGWDGTYKGIHVQEGVYVFVINGSGVDGTAFSRTGTVTLIR